MYSALKNDKLIKVHLPDYPDGHIPDQELFHKLVASLYPTEFYELIISAFRSRSVYQSRGTGVCWDLPGDGTRNLRSDDVAK